MIERAGILALIALACVSTSAFADGPSTTSPPGATDARRAVVASGPTLMRRDGIVQPRQSTLRLHWDNDRYAMPAESSDRWYTQGLALEFAYQPDWARSFGCRMPGACGFDRTGAGFVLGQLIFTPEAIRRYDLIEDDRPYAGYLYAGVFWQRANQCVLDHLQLDVGVVGPSSRSEEAQRWVHDLINTVTPNGWDHQLDDEPTIQLYGRRKWRFGTNLGSGWRAEAIPQVGLALGTVYRNVEAGALARVGIHLPDDFGPARLADPGTAVHVPMCRGWRAYGFGRASARYVQHNLFLEGNTWRSSHSIDAEPFVGEVEGGLAIQYASRALSFELIWSRTLQSEEFDGQGEHHDYGRFTLSATWRP